MAKMNPEAKAKIVEALRSGKYKQGTYELRNATTNCYCVWGVICDASGVSKWTKNRHSETYEYDDLWFGPSVNVAQWVGGDNRTLTVTIDGNTGVLMELNDCFNYSFAQLADAIEEQL